MYRKLSELLHAFQVLQVKLESVLSTYFYRERSNSCSEGVVPNPYQLKPLRVNLKNRPNLRKKHVYANKVFHRN